jgi:hypothetical protein
VGKAGIDRPDKGTGRANRPYDTRRWGEIIWNCDATARSRIRKHASHFRFLLGSLGTLIVCRLGTGPKRWERLAISARDGPPQSGNEEPQTRWAQTVRTWCEERTVQEPARRIPLPKSGPKKITPTEVFRTVAAFTMPIWPLRPLGQVGMARVVRAAKGRLGGQGWPRAAD